MQRGFAVLLLAAPSTADLAHNAAFHDSRQALSVL